MSAESYQKYLEFQKLPQLYSSPADILQFIEEQNLDTPILSTIIKKAAEKKLGWTPTETDFYLNEFFEYIYNVFKIPGEENTKKTREWILHLEKSAMQGGLDHLELFPYKLHLHGNLMIFKHNRENKNYPVINFHLDTIDGITPDGVTSFFIRSNELGGQPYEFGDEYYMHVNIYSDQVHISGCDDMSWALFSDNEKERLDFVEYLKRAAPVWNFKYPQWIHPNLEFTN